MSYTIALEVFCFERVITAPIALIFTGAYGGYRWQSIFINSCTGGFLDGTDTRPFAKKVP
jgi:hypothetical protein